MGKNESNQQYNNQQLDNIIQILKDKRSFYYDGKINSNIINSIEMASKNFKNTVTRTSVRNIYNAFKDIEMQLNQKYITKLTNDNFKSDDSINSIELAMERQKEDAFSEIKPIIKLMKGKSHYLVNRKIEGLNKGQKSEKAAYENLEIFLGESINVINTAKEFEAFLKIFECLYAYLEKGRENQ